MSGPADTTLDSAWRASAPRVRVAQLHPVHGPAGPAPSSALGREAVTLGRQADGPFDVALADGEVSRRHAVLAPDEAGAWWVRDLGSRNGTFVDGERLGERTRLRSGQVLRLGRSLVVFSEHEVAADDVRGAESASLLGDSLPMRRVRGEIERVGPGTLPVLILGATGVGKERVAQAIHERSGRSGAFVPVNCAALPEHLAESELFGHEAGAFTGAVRAAEGLVAAAHGGTLFLDEVGEMPATLQPKLLRALATGEVRAVGRTTARVVDVRVVAATLRAADEALRGDLLARLAGWTIEVPPLRERREDVLALARVFLRREGATDALSTEAAEALLLHDWPFNVRELEQAMRATALRLDGGACVERGHVPLRARPTTAQPPAALDDLPLDVLVPRDRAPSAEDLRRVLARFRGNVARTAEFFGKERPQIYRWMKQLGVTAEAHRDG